MMFTMYPINTFFLWFDFNIVQSSVIVEGTEQFERWLDIPVSFNFKVYVFNITNPKEIENGGVPHIEEIGPYVYK